MYLTERLGVGEAQSIGGQIITVGIISLVAVAIVLGPVVALTPEAGMWAQFY